MRHKLWLMIGRAVYWAGWPVSYASLYFSNRARVLIICKDEVLLARNWMGSGDWHAPGGGVHRQETPVAGAVRELHEELGLDIAPDQLKKLYEKRVTTRKKFTYFGHFFVLEMPKKPDLQPNSREISEAQWFRIEEIGRDKLGSRVLEEHLEAWKRSR